MQINGNQDKHISPIVVTICRDMFRYDANEIVQQSESDNNRDSKNRHPNYRKG